MVINAICRLESSRCGWPTILATSTGKEIAIAHNTDYAYFQMTHRPSVGTGAWTEQIVSSMDSTTGLYADLVWNRTAVGGSNGDSSHDWSYCSNWFSWNYLQRLRWSSLYYRSTDGGSTWDIQDMQLPTLDSAHFNGFGVIVML